MKQESQFLQDPIFTNYYNCFSSRVAKTQAAPLGGVCEFTDKLQNKNKIIGLKIKLVERWKR